ncbi:hypothetical protein D3C76_1828180 [compost metagenome]
MFEATGLLGAAFDTVILFSILVPFEFLAVIVITVPEFCIGIVNLKFPLESLVVV